MSGFSRTRQVRLKADERRGRTSNRFAILSEAYAYATFEDRIKATNRFVEEALNYANAHAAEIRKITGAADRKALPGTTLALRAEFERSAASVEILSPDRTTGSWTGTCWTPRSATRTCSRSCDRGTDVTVFQTGFKHRSSA